MPVAMATVLDAERQWFSWRVGVEHAEPHRDLSLRAPAQPARAP